MTTRARVIFFIPKGTKVQGGQTLPRQTPRELEGEYVGEITEQERKLLESGQNIPVEIPQIAQPIRLPDSQFVRVGNKIYKRR